MRRGLILALQALGALDPKVIRWGRSLEPAWTYGDEVSGPAAGTKLVSVKVPSDKKGYIYGFFISAKEANDFLLKWTSGGAAKSVRIVFPGGGTVYYVECTALNEGYPADPDTEVWIENVNAGTGGVAYQAGLLFASS
jgi:hypothetical protein